MVPQKSNTTKKLNLKPIPILVALCLVVAGATFGILFTFARPDSTDQPISSSTINYNEPTAEEISAGEAIKESKQQSSVDPTPSAYTVFVTDASQYNQTVEVRAYVDGVIEEGGVCTFSFEQNGNSFVQATMGMADAAHTTCESLNLPISKIPAAGSWLVTVSYDSATVSVASQPQPLEVIK